MKVVWMVGEKVGEKVMKKAVLKAGLKAVNLVDKTEPWLAD